MFSLRGTILTAWKQKRGGDAKGESATAGRAQNTGRSAQCSLAYDLFINMDMGGVGCRRACGAGNHESDDGGFSQVVPARRRGQEGLSVRCLSS
jgi:hypothetical protein